MLKAFSVIGALVLSLGLGYGSLASPPAVQAATAPVVTLQSGTNGCQGVLPTPGSANTNKRLVGGTLAPGGTAIFDITYPVDATDVGQTFQITDCVFIGGSAALKYVVSFVPNNTNFILEYTLSIPSGTLGDEYCNYAKTTQSPSDSPASNRKAGPACFVVGGNLSLKKVNQAGTPLAGAVFDVSCTVPTTTAWLSALVIAGVPFLSPESGHTYSVTGVSTGSDGRILVQAPAGTVCTFTETQAPPGYLLPANPVVTGTATSDSSPTPVTMTDPAVAPALSLVKTPTPTTYSTVGAVISYSYHVTNTGNVTLAGPVTVTDDHATVTCPAGGLAPGASMTCSATYTIKQADIDAGSVTNTATAHANGVDSNQAQATVTATQSKVLGLTKTDNLNPAKYDHVGQVVTYTLTATNNGNVTLHNVSVSDAPALGSFSCVPTIPVASLAPGASVVCTGTHSITQADLDAGSFADTASATSTEANAPDAHDTILAAQSKVLGLTKTDNLNPAKYDHVGQVVTYTLTATNNGNVTLHNVSVSDAPALGSFSCVATIPVASLAPGASVVCTGTHSITQADLDAGSFADTASATSTEANAPDAHDTILAAQSKTLSLVKTADPTTYSTVGAVISYSYHVTNTGNVTLAGPVTVTDDHATVTCPAGGLAPGASMTCSATYTIKQADIDAGSVTNTATAHANGVDSNQAQATVTAVQGPALSLVKTPTPTTYSTVGAVISYSYHVTNTGNVTFAGPVTVTDDHATVTCPAGGLAPLASMYCTATYTITQADLDAGSVTNTATAHANGVDSNQAQATVTAVQTPALSLTKTPTPTTYSTVGAVISYSYHVTNTGNVTLAGPVTVTDDHATVTCPAGGLAPGASMTCSATYTIKQADIDAGSVTNTATAHANGVDSNQAQATVTAVQGPALSLVKTTTTASFSLAGDKINYKYVLTNTGNATLTGPFTITDNKFGSPIDCGTGSLAPGASTTCTSIYTVTTADISAKASITNIATGQGFFGQRKIVSNPATVTVPIQIVLAETATPGSSTTPPPTSSGSNGSSGSSTPLFALLICLAFGGLGLLAAQAQRRTLRS